MLHAAKPGLFSMKVAVLKSGLAYAGKKIFDTHRAVTAHKIAMFYHVHPESATDTAELFRAVLKDANHKSGVIV